MGIGFGRERRDSRMWKRRGLSVVTGTCLASLMLSAGCTDPREQFGRTWYIDGASNWGFGVAEVPAGLYDAGYDGLVSIHRWSLTFNPMLDQTLRFIAQGSGEQLGAAITDYLARNPGAEANIIALSAGTGVGIWAIENVRPPHKVNSFVLLGSSLSSRYDVRKALANMKGNMYVYYASRDPVLEGPVRALGTIDGTFDTSAGLVGLRGPGAAGGRVVNIPWSRKYVRYGWTGGHTDCTNRRFVKAVISQQIVGRRTPAVNRNKTPLPLGQRTNRDALAGRPWRAAASGRRIGAP